MPSIHYAFDSLRVAAMAEGPPMGPWSRRGRRAPMHDGESRRGWALAAMQRKGGLWHAMASLEEEGLQ